MGISLGSIGSAIFGGPSSAVGQALGIFGGGGGGGGGSNTTNTTSTTIPWAEQQPYLKQLFQSAQTQFNKGPQQYYPGTTVAAPGQATTQGQQQMLQAAGGAAQDVNAANQALQFNLNDAKDVNNNPYLQNAIKAAIQPAIDQFQDAGGTMSQIRTDAGTAGTGFGYGTRDDIAGGLAEARLNRDILNTGATMANQGYNTGLQASQSALATAPSVIGAGAAPAEMTSAVGNQQDAYTQSLIDDAVQRYNFNQNAPWQNLQNYQGLITGTYGNTTTGQATGPTAPTNTLGNILGGAASGAALGSFIPGLGTGIGAGAGALLGLLQSR